MLDYKMVRRAYFVDSSSTSMAHMRMTITYGLYDSINYQIAQKTFVTKAVEKNDIIIVFLGFKSPQMKQLRLIGSTRPER